MDNAIYVGLSRQMLLQRELDITANNLANVDTAGFKFELLMSSDDRVTTPTPGAAPTPVDFVTAAGVARDYTQGSLTQTGSPLDVAIDGKGFFQVSTADGPRYTRDGRFKLDPTGKLVTQDGDAVEGDGGDIVLDPKKGAVSIAANGDISQSGQSVGHLSVVSFASLAALSKDGNNLYRNDFEPHPRSVDQRAAEAGNAGGLQRAARHPDHPAHRDQPRLRRDRQHDGLDRPALHQRGAAARRHRPLVTGRP